MKIIIMSEYVTGCCRSMCAKTFHRVVLFSSVNIDSGFFENCLGGRRVEVIYLIYGLNNHSNVSMAFPIPTEYSDACAKG